MIRKKINISAMGCGWRRGEVISFHPHYVNYIVLQCVFDETLTVAKNILITRLLMKMRVW